MPSYICLVWLPTCVTTLRLVRSLLTELSSVIFESLLFLLSLVALLSLDGEQSFSDLTVILYRDGMFRLINISDLF